MDAETLRSLYRAEVFCCKPRQPGLRATCHKSAIPDVHMALSQSGADFQVPVILNRGLRRAYSKKAGALYRAKEVGDFGASQTAYSRARAGRLSTASATCHPAILSSPSSRAPTTNCRTRRRRVAKLHVIDRGSWRLDDDRRGVVDPGVDVDRTFVILVAAGAHQHRPAVASAGDGVAEVVAIFAFGATNNVDGDKAPSS